MKKMLLATALALLITDVLNRRLLFKQTSSNAKEANTIISIRFAELNWLNDKPICGGAENVVKTETDKHS